MVLVVVAVVIVVMVVVVVVVVVTVVVMSWLSGKKCIQWPCWVPKHPDTESETFEPQVQALKLKTINFATAALSP